MEKNNTKQRIISGILLSLIIVFFYNYVNPINEAKALTFATTNTNYSVVGMQYIPFGTKLYAVDIEQRFAPTNFIARVVDTNTTSTISTLNLNSSLNVAGHPTFQFQFINVSCDITGSGLCAIAFFTSNTFSRVVVFDAINNVASTLATGANLTSSYEPVVSFSHGSIQSTVFVAFQDSAGNNDMKVTSYVMNNSQSVQDPKNKLVSAGTFDTGLTAQPTNSALGSVSTGGNSGNYIAYGTTVGTMVLYKASTNSLKCTVNLQNGGGNGDIDFVQNSGGNYWLATAISTQIKKVDFSCNILATDDFSAFTNTQTIKGISHSPSRNEFYFESNSKVFVGNLTSFSSTPITSYTIDSDVGEPYGDMITNDASTLSGVTGNFVAIGESVAKIKWIYWTVIGNGGTASGSNPNGTCPDPTNSACVGNVNCLDPNFSGLAFCQLHNNPNAGLLKSNSQFITTNAGGIICSLGLANCTNTNIKTNGEGYILALIGLILLIALMLFASKLILSIPAYLWFIATIIYLGFTIAVGWLDVTWLLLSVIAIVALGAGKIKELLFGGSF